jgi:hypothetical protein
MMTGNLQGSVKAIDLSSMRLITRDKFTPLPMPPSVIEHLNSLASQQNRQLSKDPVFRIGQSLREISDDDNGIDDDIHQNYLDSTVVEVYDRDNVPSPTDGIDITTLSGKCEPETFPHVDLSIRKAGEMASPIPSSSPYINSIPYAPTDEGADLMKDFDADATTSLPTETPIILSPLKEPLPIEHSPEMPRYNLRNRRTNWREGPWQERAYETGLHISAGAAISRFGNIAIDVMQKELQQMIDKKVWTPILIKDLDIEERKSIIPSSIFLKEKFKPSGEFDKLKGRLVAGGHRQDKMLYHELISGSEDISFYNNKLSSPTVSIQAVMIQASIAAYENRKVVTIDITGAYLNADMGEIKVFMRLDKRNTDILLGIAPSYANYVEDKGSLVVRLDKALYGCIEAAKLWHDNFVSTAQEYGFIKNMLDPCVLNYYKKGIQVTMCIYVDDIMLTSIDGDLVEDVVAFLQSKYESITTHRGVSHDYLGMKFDFEYPLVKVSMHGFIDKLIKDFGIEGTLSSPATNDIFIVKESPRLELIESKKFHSFVAKLLYLSKRFRVDILQSVIFLTTRVQESTEEDMKKLKRIIKYLNYSKDLTMSLGVKGFSIMIKSYIDASFGIHVDGKSHTGVIITLGYGVIYADSSKQKIVSKSSTEAELIGLTDGASIVIWCRNYLIEQGYQQLPAIIYQDNTSAITLCLKGKSDSKRTRHVAIRYFFIKNYIERSELIIQYLPTKLMIADLLTKPLQGSLFITLRELIFGCSSPKCVSSI